MKGGWVRDVEYPSKVGKITTMYNDGDFCVTFNNEVKTYEKYNMNSIKPWEPKKDEWCLFYSDLGEVAVLAKFVKEEDGLYGAASGGFYEFCIPFTGTLPKFNPPSIKY